LPSQRRAGKGPVIDPTRDLTKGGEGEPVAQPCLFVCFRAGARPDAAQIGSVLDASGIGRVSFDPAVRRAAAATSDWVEVLIDGLTFDLLGLAPGKALSLPAPRYRFGVPGKDSCRDVIGLAPGPHLAAAANSIPVARTILRLGAALVRGLSGATAVQWHPALSLVAGEAFTGLVDGWLSGGPFPALGLTGVRELADGRLSSDGLAFFTGQEIVLASELCRDRVAATRLLVRLVDRLVAHQRFVGEEILETNPTIRLASAGDAIEVTLV
jgi:hypothetical protein